MYSSFSRRSNCSLQSGIQGDLDWQAFSYGPKMTPRFQCRFRLTRGTYKMSFIIGTRTPMYMLWLILMTAYAFSS